MSAPALYINGLGTSGVIAASESPSGARRDIGNEAMGSDGSLRITRQTRKRDLKFKTVPLTEQDALAWESLFIGEGECWNFDGFGLYGSKGTPPSANVGCTTSATTPKFGTGKLIVPATTGSITYSFPAINMFGNTAQVLWTVSHWYSTDGGTTWTHYIIRGVSTTLVAKWVNGVRNDAASTPWLSVSSAGAVTLANTTGSAVNFDDLVVLPYWILDSWGAQLGVPPRAFSPLPYLDLNGAWVPEQTVRRVIGSCEDSRIKVANIVPRSVRLDVEFRAR